MKIKGALEARDTEWNRLAKGNSHSPDAGWDMTSVREKADVIEEAQRLKLTIHLGHLMELCHLKNSQLGIEFQKYKWRVVFRGDNITDQDGWQAVFGEQGGTSQFV